VGLVVVPLTLAGVAAPFDLPLHAAHFVMQSCMGLLEWLSALPDAVWQQHAPPRWAIVAAIVGIAWMLLPRGFPARGLGAVLCLPLFLSAPAQPAEGEAKLTVLDVGHGLAVVVQTRHHALLYDTGPAFGPGADSGTRIIVPYLRASGIRRLDGMVVSHDDIDHSGGAASVLSAMPVAWVLTSLPDVDPLLFESEQAWRCHSGQSWVWDGVRFEIMGPTQASYEDATLKDNDRSCVLKIATPSGHVLLPADIERRAEGALLDDPGSDLYADVLVAPHQGSRTSSSAEFVERVQPQIVIFPVGYRNRFGHPHKDVVERYRATGAKIYRTDRDGAITLMLASEGRMRIEPFRAVYRRYWQTPFAGELPADPEAL
jgi:competence protein ComEC